MQQDFGEHECDKITEHSHYISDLVRTDCKSYVSLHPSRQPRLLCLSGVLAQFVVN